VAETLGGERAKTTAVASGVNVHSRALVACRREEQFPQDLVADVNASVFAMERQSIDNVFRIKGE
jgi:hypothetical protein